MSKYATPVEVTVDVLAQETLFEGAQGRYHAWNLVHGYEKSSTDPDEEAIRIQGANDFLPRGMRFVDPHVDTNDPYTQGSILHAGAVTSAIRAQGLENLRVATPRQIIEATQTNSRMSELVGDIGVILYGTKGTNASHARRLYRQLALSGSWKELISVQQWKEMFRIPILMYSLRTEPSGGEYGAKLVFDPQISRARRAPGLRRDFHQRTVGSLEDVLIGREASEGIELVNTCPRFVPKVEPEARTDDMTIGGRARAYDQFEAHPMRAGNGRTRANGNGVRDIEEVENKVAMAVLTYAFGDLVISGTNLSGETWVQTGSNTLPVVNSHVFLSRKTS